MDWWGINTNKNLSELNIGEALHNHTQIFFKQERKSTNHQRTEG